MNRTKKGQAEHDREVRRVANEYLKKGYKFWLTFKTGNNLTHSKGTVLRHHRGMPPTFLYQR